MSLEHQEAICSKQSKASPWVFAQSIQKNTTTLGNL